MRIAPRWMVFGCLFLAAWGPGTAGAHPPLRPATAPSPAAQAPRPALAIRLTPEGDGVRAVVAINYLVKPDDIPRFEGVRFYTYTVPANGQVLPVGYAGRPGEARLAVLLAGKRYTYAPAWMDRQENGSLSVTKLADGEYHLRGVYVFPEQLFVIDARLAAGEGLLLVEDGR